MHALRSLMKCVTIVPMYLSVGCSKDTTAADAEYFRKELVSAATEWKEYINDNVSIGMSVEDLDRVMEGKYRERDNIPWSGGGDYFVLYRVDDHLATFFTIDGAKRICAARCQEFDRGVVKGPRGNLFWWDNRYNQFWILDFTGNREVR